MFASKLSKLATKLGKISKQNCQYFQYSQYFRKVSGKFPGQFSTKKFMEVFAALHISLKYARSDFGKPGFFSRGEISK